MSHYLALDPGETTGWAAFDENGNSAGFSDVQGRVAVYELLEREKPSVIIMEDYLVDPEKIKGHFWSPVETIRVIGAVEGWAYFNKAKVILQSRTVKPIAYMWAGITKPKAKAMTHQTDAYVHGVYFLQKHGVRRPQQGAANVC